MNDELFGEPVGVALSPRLAWMQKHGIITFNGKEYGCRGNWYAGFQSWHPGQTGFVFFAKETGENGNRRVGEGDTEEDALVSLLTCWDAKKQNLKLWNEEDCGK